MHNDNQYLSTSVARSPLLSKYGEELPPVLLSISAFSFLGRRDIPVGLGTLPWKRETVRLLGTFTTERTGSEPEAMLR